MKIKFELTPQEADLVVEMAERFNKSPGRTPRAGEFSVMVGLLKKLRMVKPLVDVERSPCPTGTTRVRVWLETTDDKPVCDPHGQRIPWPASVPL